MKPTVSIIGGGACALMLGCELSTARYHVRIYEQNAAPGRKFLVAGDGGLNLTHSEPAGDFIQRYTPFPFLEPAFRQFSNRDFINWLNGLGIETYVGSSGRVFPKQGIKPVEVLNVLLQKIKQNRVELHMHHQWKGFAPDNTLLMEHKGTSFALKSDIVIFCLGGASWPVTGSQGSWAAYFKNRGLLVNPFEASNCAYRVNWPTDLIAAIKGKALKNGVVHCEGTSHAGEVLLTAEGIEGSGIYPLSPPIRRQLKQQGRAEVFVDMKPLVTIETLLQRINMPRGKNSYTAHLEKQLNLNRVQLALLRHLLSKEDFVDAEKLVSHIKKLRIVITSAAPVEEAISTVGGLALEETGPFFELKKLPNHFAIGEMLDFDAPTGGYLLQSCFSMGKWLADRLNAL